MYHQQPLIFKVILLVENRNFSEAAISYLLDSDKSLLVKCLHAQYILFFFFKPYLEFNKIRMSIYEVSTHMRFSYTQVFNSLIDIKRFIAHRKVEYYISSFSKLKLKSIKSRIKFRI